MRLDPVVELFEDLDDLRDIVLIDEPSKEDFVDDPLIEDALDEVDFRECGDDLPDEDFLNDFLDEPDLADDDLADMDDDLSEDDEANLPDLLDFSLDVVEPGIEVDLLMDVGLMNDSFRLCFNEC